MVYLRRLVDGIAPADRGIVGGGTAAAVDGQTMKKSAREAPFPVVLLDKGMRARVQDGQASVAADKQHILNAIIAERSENLEPNPTIWFSSFGDFSLNIEVIYYINKDGHWAYSPGEVNLEILKRFNAAGLDFAFPTQTLLTPDVAPR